MRILHLLSQRPDSTGSGIYLQEMLRHAKTSGHTNFLICALPSREKITLQSVHEDHCKVIYFETDQLPFPIVGMSDVMPYPSTRFCDLTSENLERYINTFTKALKEAIAQFKPDIIHSHHLWIASALIKDLAQSIPLVTSCHGSDLRQFRNQPSLRKIVRDGCQKIDHIFALTNSQKKDIANLYGIDISKISTVGGGFNSKIFNLQNRNNASNQLRMLYAGKLSYAKGVPYLIEALAQIPSTNYTLTLVGAGTGHEKDDCLSLASENDRITIQPPVHQKELAQLLKESDLFILPSLYEGMPLVVLEALACGCNVLVSELPGIVEIIERTKTSNIKTIALPESHSANRLTNDHSKLFIQNIYDQLQIILKTFTPYQKYEICDVSYFSWQNVFHRIQSSYKNFL